MIVGMAHQGCQFGLSNSDLKFEKINFFVFFFLLKNILIKIK